MEHDGGVVVLVSGGIDSAVCLALARGATSRIAALTFDYGQVNRPELAAAAALAAHYGAEHVVVALDLAAVGGSELLRRPGDADHPDAPPPKAAYVPARNLVFLAVAGGLAEARGYDRISFGCTRSDVEHYPDARPDFVRALEAAMALGLRCGAGDGRIAIRTPIAPLTKTDVVKAAHGLGVPLELTWSCYGRGPGPCGRCGACWIRADAFTAAGLADPAAGSGSG